jgi:hypothetical protein
MEQPPVEESWLVTSGRGLATYLQKRSCLDFVLLGDFLTMPDPKSAARLYFNAWREAGLLLCVWAAAFFWTVSYCYLNGYRHAPESWLVQAGLAVVRSDEDLHALFGFPDWVFYGIMIPWASCTVFTVLFSIFILRDDDLGAEVEERPAHGH